MNSRWWRWTVLHELGIVNKPFFPSLSIIFASENIYIYGGHMFMFCPGPSVQFTPGTLSWPAPAEWAGHASRQIFAAKLRACEWVPNDEFANFRKSGCGAASSWPHPHELTRAENLLNFRISISLLRFISGEIQLASDQSVLRAPCPPSVLRRQDPAQCRSLRSRSEWRQSASTRRWEQTWKNCLSIKYVWLCSLCCDCERNFLIVKETPWKPN